MASKGPANSQKTETEITLVSDILEKEQRTAKTIFNRCIEPVMVGLN